MRYVASVDGHEYQIELEEPGLARVDGEVVAVELESIDGGFHYSLLAGPSSHEVFVERCEGACFVILDGQRYEVRVEEMNRPLTRRRQRSPRGEAGEVEVTSPMPGVVVAVLADEGQRVRSGEGLASLEAMKMENEIRSPQSGTVVRVGVTAGQRVSQDDLLFLIVSSPVS